MFGRDDAVSREEGECAAVASMYHEAGLFRATIEMKRYRFGEGEYRYFKAPLPEPVGTLRRLLYPRLLPIARDWHQRLGREAPWPGTLEAWLKMCHDAGQPRPTPLLLRYGPDGFNRLHQDVYGAVAFPLQVTCLLSRPEDEFRGGAFVLVEQRPREQARVEAIDLEQGEAVVFPNQVRPAAGRRGHHRVQVRHGVSRLHAGDRTTLGIIFHDAR